MTDKSSLGKLGKYELLERIGEGGFGIVYKARDPLLEREVAVKVLRSDIASAPDFVERFRREARLAASLRHPNIVSVIEVGEQDGRYYLVMEYLEGEVLSERLKDGQPLPLSQAVEILSPIAEALDYAHARGLIHRDVKPSNIILADGGKCPVLTDFGLVKSLSEAGMTTTGVSLGTVEYMAPEQILGHDSTPATDLYALGAIAYQMFTGRVPFTGNTPFEIQNGHVNNQPPDPCILNPTFPRPLVDVLVQALAKEPAGRFSSGRELVAAMQKETGKLSADKAMILLKEAETAASRSDFESAITNLEQALLIQPLPEITEQLQEYRRRQQVWKEYQELQEQKKKVDASLSELSREHEWLAAPTSVKVVSPSVPIVRPSHPGTELSEEPDHKKDNIARKVQIMKVSAWVLFILQIFSFLLIFTDQEGWFIALVISFMVALTLAITGLSTEMHPGMRVFLWIPVVLCGLGIINALSFYGQGIRIITMITLVIGVIVTLVIAIMLSKSKPTNT